MENSFVCSQPSRRGILRYASAAVCAGVLRATPQSPSMPFPVAARARLSVTSYPFRANIESPTNHGRDSKFPGMDLKAFPAFAVETFGIHNINPLVDHFSSLDPSYLNAFRVAVDKAGSRIVDLGLAGKQFYAGDKAIRQDAVSFGQQCVDIAVQVGSPSVRQHVAGHEGDRPDVAVAAESLGQLAEYGAKRNVVINLENDSFVSEDPFFLIAVIEKANNPYLRGLPDFGNSLLGHDDQYNQRAVDGMLSHVFNVCHVKDVVRGQDGKHYQVDLGAMFKLARQHAYRGFFCMEFDSNSGDPIAGTKQLIAETLSQMSDRQ